MAQSRIEDYLQSFPFHLLDVSIASAGFVPIPVLTPVLGFTSITAPEMTASVRTVKEGNNEFPRKIIEGGEVGTITLRRGSRFFDSDFYRWVLSCIKGGGTGSLRRTLVLVHFANLDVASIAGIAGTAGLGAAVALGIGERFSIAETAAVEGGLLGVAAAVGLLPAKTWLLQKCLGTRVKTANDFDATDSSVSVMELDIECEMFEEFSVGS